MKDWEMKPARDVGLPPMERYRSLDREDGLLESIVRLAWWVLVRAVLILYNRLRVEGRENLPRESPFILVANHESHLDALVLASVVPLRHRDRLFPLAAGDVFFERSVLAGFAATALNALPVWRKRCGARGLEGLRKRLIEDRSVYILFPEGARSRTGIMGRFKPGLGMLVAGTSIPVVPCYLDGTLEAFRPGRMVPRPHKVTVRIGKPLGFSDFAGDRPGWNRVATEVESAVRKLSDLVQDHSAGRTSTRPTSMY
jgi:1-acyl-sn-glycerol-3-phosphate acyltransferase